MTRSISPSSLHSFVILIHSSSVTVNLSLVITGPSVGLAGNRARAVSLALFVHSVPRPFTRLRVRLAAVPFIVTLVPRLSRSSSLRSSSLHSLHGPSVLTSFAPEPGHSLRLRSHYRSIFVSLIPPCSPLRLSFPHYTHSTRGAAGSPEGATRCTEDNEDRRDETG